MAGNDPPPSPPPPPPPSVIPPPFNAKDFVIQKGYWLNGEKNYFQWSQLIRQTLKGCDMIDHLDGDPPLVTAPKHMVGGPMHYPRFKLKWALA
ncbi:hypothetical protein QL285_005791 [Trifolium repens]|nr:hypothetical protein QL285_005791 [Trifolium repens]